MRSIKMKLWLLLIGSLLLVSLSFVLILFIALEQPSTVSGSGVEVEATPQVEKKVDVLQERLWRDATSTALGDSSAVRFQYMELYMRYYGPPCRCIHH